MLYFPISGLFNETDHLNLAHTAELSIAKEQLWRTRQRYGP
jgi:hypothetical protein